MIENILKYNRRFVADNNYEKYKTDKYPEKKIAIVSCMDTRLTELLPAALGIKNGDAKIIKNAGAVISNPFDSTVRSLLVAIYELGVKYIMIIAHTDCGARHMDSKCMINKMKSRGITDLQINMIGYCGIDIEKWLSNFDDTEQSVLDTVNLLKHHPLIPKDIFINGFIINSETGFLKQII